jgi:colanic acid biosynthesis glycosyl transferase WcaI
VTPRRSTDREPTAPSMVLDDFAGHPHTFDLAAALSELGIDVTYQYCADDPGPKGARPIEGLAINPVTLPSGFAKYSAARRIRDELRYGWRSSRRMPRRADVVLSCNMPVLSGFVELIAAKVRRQRFVVWWQDRQGGLARASGGGELVARGLELAERFLLRAADGVIAISPDFAEEARRVRRDPSTVLLQPNWGTIGRIDVMPRHTEWRREHGIDEETVFLYTGTMGRKHDPRLLVAISERFAGDPSIMVVACCSGEGTAVLRAAEASHPNLRVLPLVDQGSYPAALGAADVLVGLLERDASAHSIPSKVLTYLCAGRPILVAASEDNLVAITVQNAAAGWVVPPEAEAVADAAEAIVGDAEQRRKAGEAGRRYAEENFDITAISQRFSDFLFER